MKMVLIYIIMILSSLVIQIRLICRKYLINQGIKRVTLLLLVKIIIMDKIFIMQFLINPLLRFKILEMQNKNIQIINKIQVK
jgi:hypothetical protein